MWRFCYSYKICCIHVDFDDIENFGMLCWIYPRKHVSHEILSKASQWRHELKLLIPLWCELGV